MIDELLNVALYILIFALGFRLGSRWVIWKIARFVIDRRKDLPQILKELDVELDAVERRPDSLPNDAVEINVEREGEHYYLYRKSNNQFLGQGATLKDALDSVKKRFPDETFWGSVERELALKWGLNKEVERQNS